MAGQQFSTTRYTVLELQQVIDAWAATRTRLTVLEAGCGSASRVRLPQRATLVGIDISRIQLERNRSLDRRILGDLQYYQFDEGRFDLIVCWDVLEHIERPRLAMERLMRALAPGGLFVIAVPTLWSIKGLVARLTPFAVHRAFYRRVIGDKYEGTAKQDQFPTMLRLEMAARRLRRLGLAHGLSAPFFRTYEGPVQQALRERYGVADALFALTGWISRVVSLGRLDLTHSDALIVLSKAAAGPGEEPVRRLNGAQPRPVVDSADRAPTEAAVLSPEANLESEAAATLLRR